MSVQDSRTPANRWSLLGVLATAGLVAAGAVASAGPLYEIVKAGALAAYPEWFLGSLSYVAAAVTIGLILKGRVRRSDLLVVGLVVSLPVFIGMMNVLSDVMPSRGTAHHGMMETSPTFHALAVYLAAGFIFLTGAREFVARRRTGRCATAQKISSRPRSMTNG